MVVTITSAYGGSYGTKKPKPYWWCGRDRDIPLVHDLIARGHLLFKDQFLLKLYAKWWHFIWRQIKIKVAYMLDASKKNNKCRGLAKCVRWDLQFVSTWGNEMSRGKEGIRQRDDAIYMARHPTFYWCARKAPGPSINPWRGSICDCEGPGRPVRVAKTPARLPRVKRTYKEQPG